MWASRSSGNSWKCRRLTRLNSFELQFGTPGRLESFPEVGSEGLRAPQNVRMPLTGVILSKGLKTFRRPRNRVDLSPPSPEAGQAAFFLNAGRCLLACAKRSSNSPARTASMRVLMTVGSLSFDGTTMPALPFSNSMGFVPNLIDITI